MFGRLPTVRARSTSSTARKRSSAMARTLALCWLWRGPDGLPGANGLSLLAVETDRVTGFRRGRKLDKVGMHAQDTAELFFDDVKVPAENVLGLTPRRGFVQLMQQLAWERLSVALGAVSSSAWSGPLP